MDADNIPEPPKAGGHRINWLDVIGAAFLAGAFQVLGQLVESQRERSASGPDATVDAISDDEAAVGTDDGEGDPDEEAVAAALLGVSTDASEDEIRGALRARLSSSRLHPDHGGDGDEAKMLIAAKNLLVNRARSRSRTVLP